MTVRDADGTVVEIDCSSGCQLGGALIGDDELVIAVSPLNTTATATGGTVGLAIGAEIVAMTAAYQDAAGNPLDLANSPDIILG